MGTIIKTLNNNQFELKYNLFNHQKETIKFMLKNKKCFVFNEAGTGKTECAISVFMYHLLSNNCKKVLIVSTLSSLKTTWYNSIENNNLNIKYKVIYDKNKNKRLKLLKEDLDVYIINYNSISNLFEELNSINFDCIIIDEATVFKNAMSKRSKSMIKLCNKSKYTYVMTGTPVPNYARESYGLLRLLYSDKYTNFNNFRLLIENKINDYIYIEKKDAYKTVSQLLKPAIVYKIKDCIDIPDIVFKYYHCEIDKKLDEQFKQLKKEYLLLNDNKEVIIDSSNSAVNYINLFQILGGTCKDVNDNIIHFNVDSKYEVLEEIIENQVNDKVIIFCQFVEQINNIYNFLKDKYDCAKIVGSVNYNERSVIFDKFQNSDKIKILIANISTCAHSITLTRANHIIYFNAVFSNDLYQQSIARIYRNSQKNKCIIHNLYYNDFDFNVFKKLEKREYNQNQLLSLLKNN